MAKITKKRNKTTTLQGILIEVDGGVVKSKTKGRASA
jgi:hypothetical protein